MARVDYDEMSRRYDRGRAHDDWQVEPWRVALLGHLPSDATMLLDLGSGTGAWSARLASWFDLFVIGVEPSDGMRSRAPGDPYVAAVAGAAEAIPLRASSCDAAWLSVVVHHFADLFAAAAECRRVLRPGAPVLIRSAVPGVYESTEAEVERLAHEAGWHDALVTWPARWFPESRAVLDSFPSLDDLDAAFGPAGFERTAAELVANGQANSLREFYEKVSQRADTTLVGISDEAFAAGLDRLRVAVESGEGERPVAAAIPLVVYR